MPVAAARQQHRAGAGGGVRRKTALAAVRCALGCAAHEWKKIEGQEIRKGGQGGVRSEADMDTGRKAAHLAAERGPKTILGIYVQRQVWPDGVEEVARANVLL